MRVFAASVGFIFLIVLLAVCYWWLNINVLQPARHQTIVHDANNAIYNKAWFHDECGAIRTYSQNVESNQRALASVSSQSEKDRLGVVIEGNRQQLNSAVNTYNAAVRNTDRSIFLDYNESPTGEGCK